MCDIIRECAKQVSQSSSDVRAVVLTGSSDCFSAGKDLKASLKHSEAEARSYYSNTLLTVKSLLDIPVPVIVGMEKVCLGLGLELSLTGDIRIAGESCKIGFPEIHLNLFPGCGGAVLLPAILGNACLASELILSGRRLSAKEALDINLISRIVPDGSACETAMEIARTLVEKNRNLLIKTKEVVRYNLNRQLKETEWWALAERNRLEVAEYPEHKASLIEFFSKK